MTVHAPETCHQVCDHAIRTILRELKTATPDRARELRERIDAWLELRHAHTPHDLADDAR